MTVIVIILLLILAQIWGTVIHTEDKNSMVGMECHSGSMEEHNRTNHNHKLSNQFPIIVAILVQAMVLVVDLVVNLLDQVDLEDKKDLEEEVHLHPVMLMLVHLLQLQQLLDLPLASSTSS